MRLRREFHAPRADLHKFWTPATAILSVLARGITDTSSGLWVCWTGHTLGFLCPVQPGWITRFAARQASLIADFRREIEGIQALNMIYGSQKPHRHQDQVACEKRKARLGEIVRQLAVLRPKTEGAPRGHGQKNLLLNASCRWWAIFNRVVNSGSFLDPFKSGSVLKYG